MTQRYGRLFAVGTLPKSPFDLPPSKIYEMFDVPGRQAVGVTIAHAHDGARDGVSVRWTVFYDTTSAAVPDDVFGFIARRYKEMFHYDEKDDAPTQDEIREWLFVESMGPKFKLGTTAKRNNNGSSRKGAKPPVKPSRAPRKNLTP